MKGPCFKCVDRYIGCHANCNAYIEWRIEFDTEKEFICNKKKEEQAMQEVLRRGIKRSKYSRPKGS